MTENSYSDDSTEAARTAALHGLTINNLAADRDWWKEKYRILKKILMRNGIEVIEDEHGNLDIKAMRANGAIPAERG